jgi:hypothetical protein
MVPIDRWTLLASSATFSAGPLRCGWTRTLRCAPRSSAGGLGHALNLRLPLAG